jgi:hypothetical protein
MEASSQLQVPIHLSMRKETLEHIGEEAWWAQSLSEHCQESNPWFHVYLLRNLRLKMNIPGKALCKKCERKLLRQQSFKEIWRPQTDEITAKGWTASHCYYFPLSTAAECMQIHANSWHRGGSYEVFHNVGLGSSVCSGVHVDAIKRKTFVRVLRPAPANCHSTRTPHSRTWHHVVWYKGNIIPDCSASYLGTILPHYTGSHPRIIFIFSAVRTSHFICSWYITITPKGFDSRDSVTSK